MPEQDQNTRASLLLRLRDSADQEAWDQCVEIYTPIIYGFCRAKGLQDADAADICQEVLRAVVRAMETFEYDRQRGKFRSWLLTVTRSRLNNFFTHRQRHHQPRGASSIQTMLDNEPTPSEQSTWDSEYHGRLFEWAIAQVQPTVQEATWLAFWRTMIDQEDGATVAADLKMSVGAVYVAKSRVLTRLKEKIQSVDPDAELAQPASP